MISNFLILFIFLFSIKESCLILVNYHSRLFLGWFSRSCNYYIVYFLFGTTHEIQQIQCLDDFDPTLLSSDYGNFSDGKLDTHSITELLSSRIKLFDFYKFQA